MKMKTSRIIATIAASFFIGSTLHAQTWKAKAISDMKKGDFAKVEQTISKLSQEEQNKHAWLIDSLQAIMSRIRDDFRLSREEGKKLLLEKVPGATDKQIEAWKQKKYLETRMIDGEERWFRKTISNFALLNKDVYPTEIVQGKKKEYAKVHPMCEHILTQKLEENNTCDWKKVNATFYIEVPADAVPAGETIKAWLPYPFDNGRQRNFQLLSSSSQATHSSGSLHHTVYMEQKAVKGQPTRFEMKFSYEVGAQVFHQADILKNLKSYDKQSDLYKKFTAQELPHMLVNKQMKTLAQKIVGTETNPVLQASMIYDWISANYPWAGAIDYSTIPCIPQYELDINHGDCGQVTLLYISMLRSLGIPARWESGWVFDESGWTGYHDWGEIYFEGTGWVPTDVSAGRDTYQEPFQDFFKTSTDAYRLATNEGIGGEFSPKKQYIRRETVDFQAGEVEWKGGNLTTWKSGLKIDQISTETEEMKALLASIKKTYAPDSRVAIYELESQKADKQWIIKGKVDKAELKTNVLQELQKANVSVIDSIAVLEFTKEKPWGLVKLSIASLRTGGKHAAEMATQAIMGTPVKILEHAGDWARVQTPDQYISYVPKNSLYQITQAQLDAWRQSTRYIVDVYQTQLVDAPKNGMTVSDLVMGNILEYKGKSGKYIKLATPDGREGYVHQSEVKELTEWANQTFNAELIKKVAFRMMGSGYLWGGTSTKLTDCSGLVKVSYFANGIILQRDAYQQALTGKIIKAENWKEAQLGDLLFWGTKSGRVTHVGIYLKDGEYIHCSGQVKLNSLDPESPKWLSTPFLSISRINGMIGTKGIIMAKDHPWYF